MPYNAEKGPDPEKEQRPREDKKTVVTSKLGQQAVNGAKNSR